MERTAIDVQGIVQGVGFRPFVYGLACRLQLVGYVKNQLGSVHIEVEGSVAELQQFEEVLRTDPPPLARIDSLRQKKLPVRGDRAFRIEASSEDSPTQIFISPDIASCADCCWELFSPQDRRYQYPLLNCTNCGPRLTIIHGAPYDRARTTMASFTMCTDCQAEYEDPGDRRFHAQPIACPACGPQISVLDSNGTQIETHDPLARFAAALKQGEIGAVKGLGGFHLTCCADDPNAINRLRQRKHRDEKPLAVMVLDLAMAQDLCEVSPEEQELLTSPRSPIVLLSKMSTLSQSPVSVIEAVAPGNPGLGVMLPNTPLHHMLIKAMAGQVLVMTSGNRADEPIAITTKGAIDQLQGIADVFLTHDRPIRVRCDDSVTQIVGHEPLLVRRSRGYAPEPIKLPMACPSPMLAVGGQLKGVFALGRDHQAFLSHHLGDLDHYAAYCAFERDIELYEQLFQLRPQLLVHDMHPDYASTKYSLQRADEQGIARLGVQHHHAHLASCLAEHDLDEPVIGVTWDGTGYGLDKAIWGGEFLVGGYRQFTRAAHLRYVRLPGGDQAIRQTWRIGLSQLQDAGCSESCLLSDVAFEQRRAVTQMIERGFNSPFTSSAGRLFDAAAAIAGVRTRAQYEGQAALQLQWLATDVAENGAYPFELLRKQHLAEQWTASDHLDSKPALDIHANVRPIVIDTRPLIRALAQDVRRGVSPAMVARRFHSTLVEMIAVVCCEFRDQTSLSVVALSGGVFLNRLLLEESIARLAAEGFRVYRHRQAPPGDGGLSLGQLAIAASLGTLSANHTTLLEPDLPVSSLFRGDDLCA